MHICLSSCVYVCVCVCVFTYMMWMFNHIAKSQICKSMCLIELFEFRNFKFSYIFSIKINQLKLWFFFSISGEKKSLRKKNSHFELPNSSTASLELHVYVSQNFLKKKFMFFSLKLKNHEFIHSHSKILYKRIQVQIFTS